MSQSQGGSRKRGSDDSAHGEGPPAKHYLRSNETVAKDDAPTPAEQKSQNGTKRYEVKVGDEVIEVIEEE